MNEPSGLRDWISYDPETGLFVLLQATTARSAGTILNINELTIQRSGKPVRVTQLSLRGKKWRAGRLAWFLMTGEFPNSEVDHADNDGWNNRWLNLRLATRSQNQANTRHQHASYSGIKGVFASGSKMRPWRAQLQKDKSRVYLGLFETREEAAAAYARAMSENFGEFARVA